MSAWVKQLKRQVEKLGEDRASWYVEWNEPDGTRRIKSCGPGAKGRKAADRLCERRKAELLTGTYNAGRRRTWADFKAEYKRKVLCRLGTGSVREAMNSLNHFERILNLKNKKLCAVTKDRIDEFVTTRLTERGKKPGSTVSPATVNSNLRHVKAALRVAGEWEWLEKVPKIAFVREPQRLPRYVTEEHFALIYASCDVAELPDETHYSPAEWWRGLLVMAELTGWRKSELLSLEWQDVDLERGRAITRARHNKGKRDEMIALHPAVVEHLKPLQTFHPRVFPWEHNERRLYDQFAEIQDAAAIKLPCQIDRPHECTAACHRYGFHDERRSFATHNATNMTLEALQSLMRHRSPLTTQRYINMARQLNPAVANLHVPAVLKPNAAG